MEVFWENLSKFLNRTLVYPKKIWVQLLICIIIFCSIFIFLIYYTPFCLNELGNSRFFPSLVYASITSAVVFIVLFVSPFIKKVMVKPDGFTNRNVLILMAITLPFICIGNWTYNFYSIYSPLISVGLNYVILLINIIYLPLIFIANIFDWKMRKLVIVDLPFLEERNNHDKFSGDNENIIAIKNSNNKIIFSAPISEVICAFSNQNYTDIYTLNNGFVEKTLLRIPFGKFFEQFDSFPQIIRCHRTRIINLKFISALIEDDNKKLIRLKYCSEAIPVSRNYPIEEHLFYNYKNGSNKLILDL